MVNRFKPAYDGEFPSLGSAVAAWIESNLAMPDRTVYEPFILTDDQYNFLVNLLRVDRATGQNLVYRRGVFSRPKGSGKSPFMAALALAFALGPVIPCGYDGSGRPLGAVLRDFRTPLVQIAAVSEDQAANTYTPLLEMVRLSPTMEDLGVEALDTYVALPGGAGTGRIETVTASATSREGNRPYLVLMDQTESWTSNNGGVRLAEVLRRNAAKVNGLTLETPNSYRPGSGSVSELSSDYYNAIRKAKNLTPIGEGLLYDHKEAPADTDLADEDSLRAGLTEVYAGCPWVDIDRLVAESRDKSVSPEDFRQYYLNQVTASSDAWITKPDWDSCLDQELDLEPGDEIVLGFDGSRGRRRGKADATALVAMRISDRLLTPIHIWEQPDGVDQWTPPVDEVNKMVDFVFKTYRVKALFCDPSGWQDQVAVWESKYGRRMAVKAGRDSPMSVWPRGKGSQISRNVEDLREAIVNSEIKQNGNPYLTEHVLNARRRAVGRQGYLLYKEHPDSARKVDAAYSSVMAYMAYLQAVKKNSTGTRRKARARIYR